MDAIPEVPYRALNPNLLKGESVKFFIVTSIMMMSMSAVAQSSIPAMNNFKAAMKSIVGDTKKAKDVRLNVSKVDAGICGSGGLSLVATLEVVKHTRTFDEKTGGVALVTSFVPVKQQKEKPFAIPLPQVVMSGTTLYLFIEPGKSVL